MTKNRGNIVIILFLIIILLLGIILYLIVVKPTINNYVADKQVEAYNRGIEDAVALIIRDIEQRGFTQLSVGNKTIFLVPAEPSK